MSYFLKQLALRNAKNHRPKKWVFVPYDQLNAAFFPDDSRQISDFGIVLVETTWKGNRRPYHKQKLATLLANQRHFALETAERGYSVSYLFSEVSYGSTLQEFCEKNSTSLEMMEAAEYELRKDLENLIRDNRLRVHKHRGWLTGEADFDSVFPEPPFRMDRFYRNTRKKYKILMEGRSPAGGKLSFDADNRKSWKGDPPAPAPPQFPVDEIKEEVGHLIQEQFQDHPGKLRLEFLASTMGEAAAIWSWAKRECLEHFGPYQDAMSLQSPSVFHTRISTLLNLHRLLPEQVLDDVHKMDLPLQSKEGFIRQILGWREFVRHVHRRTEGFRSLASHLLEKPGDGGYQEWRGTNWTVPHDPSAAAVSYAAPNYLEADIPLPPVFWGAKSGLLCLDTVVEEVWSTGYGHHITRLMILASIATMLGVIPREVTDWFWIAYTDAYDWVVEPNVLGMGTYAAGNLMTTKPYVSGAAYINRMSDYCHKCSFDPATNCPVTALYWQFLSRNLPKLEQNQRMVIALHALKRRSVSNKNKDLIAFNNLRESLSFGIPVN